MTVSSITRKAGPFDGNGATTEFPFAFKVFTTADVLVVLTDPNGVESDQTIVTDYTLSLNADQDANPGGTITMGAAPATGYKLTATSQVANKQETDITNGGGFYPQVIEDALDRCTIQVQQIQEGLNRSMVMPLSSDLASFELSVGANADDRALKAIGFDVSGNPTLLGELDNGLLGTVLPEIGTYALLRAYTGAVTAFYVRGVANLFDGGAGVFRVDASDTTSADNGGTIIVDAAGRRWKRERPASELRASWFGVVGDYAPATDTGTDDTVAMQSLFAAIADGDTVLIDRPSVLLDRDSASIKTVDGVTSYICVASGKKGVKFSGGTIYQRYNALDTVGVCFYQCDDLTLDVPVFDGNFRYTAGQPITYKQQLLHLINCKRSRGGFTVRNASNVGFLISNQYGVGSGYTTHADNDSIFHTVISENCGQNTTFGSGVSRVIIDNLIVKNPILSGMKLSSRIDAGAVADAYKGIAIGNFVLSFDSTYVVPDNDTDTALNGYLVGLDCVSAAGDVSVGRMAMDFADSGAISSVAVKHAPQENGDTSRKCGPLHIGLLNVRNQSVTNSVILLIDVEAKGTHVETIEFENVSKIIEVSNIVSAPVGTKTDKWLRVGTMKGRTLSRVALNVLSSYDADFIEIGKMDVTYAGGYSLQAVRIDSSCNLNRFTIDQVNTNSIVTVLGTINDRVSLKGVINASAQAADPLSVDLASLGSSTLKIDGLRIVGNGDVGRRVFLRNVGTFIVGEYALSGCPAGFVVVNFSKFRLTDAAPDVTGLTVLQPWQFSGTLGAIQGCFAYSGSPNSTQIADIGCSYRRTDTGQMYMKTASSGANTGWAPLT